MCAACETSSGKISLGLWKWLRWRIIILATSLARLQKGVKRCLLFFKLPMPGVARAIGKISHLSNFVCFLWECSSRYVCLGVRCLLRQMGAARFRAQLCAADGKIPADARRGAPLNGDEGGLRFAGRFFHVANFLHIPMVIGGGIFYEEYYMPFPVQKYTSRKPWRRARAYQW